MLKWFNTNLLSISGTMLKEKALYFAKELNILGFKTSTGWLDSFKKRNCIIFGTQSGESGSVNAAIVDSWKLYLKTQCEGYTPKDIYNLDESGLFYHTTTKKIIIWW